MSISKPPPLISAASGLFERMRRSTVAKGTPVESYLSSTLSLTGDLDPLTLSEKDQRISDSVESLENDQKTYMDKFLVGFKRFRSTYFASNSNLFESLKIRQAPKTVLIGCCDSRVDPAIITDCDPGDIFTIRNVANLIAPYHPDGNQHGVSAALEYAVMVLHVKTIIVMGHSNCGGIEALMRGTSKKFEFIASWMNVAQNARQRTLKYFGDRPFEDQCRACELASILGSLENAITYPWIKERLREGDLTLVGWYFDFNNGQLMGYNPEKFQFESLVEK